MFRDDLSDALRGVGSRAEIQIGPVTVKFGTPYFSPITSTPMVMEISKNLDTIYLTQEQAVSLASEINKRYPAPTTGQ